MWAEEEVEWPRVANMLLVLLERMLADVKQLLVEDDDDEMGLGRISLCFFWPLVVGI